MRLEPDFSAQIDASLRKKSPELQEVAQRLRALVRKIVPGVKESINPWRMPTLEFHGPMCYFSVGKNHVTFGFLRGTWLDDPEKLLEGTGKNLRHVKLRSVEDVVRSGLRKLVKQAARLNRETPQLGMRPGRKPQERTKGNRAASRR